MTLRAEPPAILGRGGEAGYHLTRVICSINDIQPVSV